ncbi:hypothetical protein AAG570_008532 [Ranatra chinensis]|uniref:WD repeat domain-containing protein 83 n=1 Tax=Ranatra chinensis TaxID=642074 RepID=A0ABD0YTB7_9HEMI
MDYKCLKTINCKQRAVRGVRFNVDGSYCLSCGSDKTIKLWNPHKGLLLKTYEGHGNEVLDSCGSCDSSQILSGGKDRCVILWDVATGKTLRRLREHASNVTCVKFNEEASVAISGSHDNTVMFWDLRSHSFQPIQVLRDAKDSITAVQVTDHEIVTGSLDMRIRRYDIRAGVLHIDYIGEPVTCINLTQDGQCYVLSTSNSIIWLFDKSTGELLSQYKGHTTGEFCIECGVDQTDTYILSGSVDSNVYCWDLAEGEVIHKLKHNRDGIVHSLHTHPTSKFIVTATQAEIHLWGVKELECE